MKPGHRLVDRATFLTGVLLCVFGAAILLRVKFLDFSNFRLGPDELFYVGYARYMAQDPQASLRTLAAEYIARQDWHIYPSPLRAGHILLASWWMHATGYYDYRALVYMSAFFSIASLPLAYLFVRRAFGPRPALLSLILFAVSPLNLAMSRRALQDSVVYFFTLLTLYLFYEALRQRNPLTTVSFALSFLTTLLVKESSVLLAAFFLLVPGIERRLYNRGLSIRPFALGVIVPLVAALAAYVGVAGGLEKLAVLATIVLASPSTSVYAIQFQSGPFFISYGVDYFLLSPLTILGCLGFVVMSLADRNLREARHAYLMTFLVVTWTAFSFFSKNVRYVIALDFPIRLLAVLLVARLSMRSGHQTGGFAAALIVVSLMAASDLLVFRHLFVVNEIYDPVTAALAEAWRRTLH